MAKRFKRSVKFKYEDLAFLEKIFIFYLEQGNLDEIEVEKTEKLVNSLYTDEDKLVKDRIAYLERKGFKVSQT